MSTLTVHSKVLTVGLGPRFPSPVPMTCLGAEAGQKNETCIREARQPLSVNYPSATPSSETGKPTLGS